MNYQILKDSALFRGVTLEEIHTMLKCLGTEQRRFAKGEVIYCAGDVVQSMGMVLAGSIQVENNDFWGNKSILDHLGPGQVFAETYACIPGEPLMVSVVTVEAAEILFLHIGRLLQTCPNSCAHHTKLIRNLLDISAQKNLVLSRRIFHTSCKSIRGRLLSYLSFQAARQNNHEFTIPFNRQQLADYLNVDRSALSNELSKMQKEGLLQVRKHHFLLENSVDKTYI